jgi:hypothetical protein
MPTTGKQLFTTLDADGTLTVAIEDVTFPDPTGASMALVDPSLDNSEGTNWTVSTLVYGAGDKGTPGQSNSGIAVRGETLIPTQFQLHQNYPNPFNAVTVIPFTIERSGTVTIAVYDLHGRKVAQLMTGDTPAHPGGQSGGGVREHSVTWDASAFPTGLYICRLEAAGKSVTRKLLLLK